ncbi:amidase [Amorphus sp. 3PC139-8]|uniref:amidase n=1 Tax=Amorphus sp. 3PC139-8 TaxID=2735676 RepID=UPI00345CDFC4
MLRTGLQALRGKLLSGELTSTDLLAEALAHITESAGEGARTFTLVLGDDALAQARRADELYAAGLGEKFPLLGIPISVKDLFDLKARVTTAGSRVLASEAPAHRDAEVVARLRRAGAVIVGRTNMTELAFSGLGLNPHYGTPLNPWDRGTGRIPGGSSSGAAISVTDAMCVAAIGTDTGGSVRIPSALCGLVGFKPTQTTVPLDGTYPLSTALDSIGPLAWSVEDCGTLYDVLSDSRAPAPALPDRLRFAVPANYVLDGMDVAVSNDFEAALASLAEAGGHSIERIEVPAFDRIGEAGRIGTFPGLEAYAAQQDRLRRQGAAFDPQVRRRIEAAGTLPDDALDRLKAFRQDTIAEARATLGAYDAVLFPTVPTVAPPLADLADDATFARTNLAMLRNPTVINFIDGCAASLPMHASGAAPTGLSVAGLNGTDRKILAVSAIVEDLLPTRQNGPKAPTPI